MRQQQNQEQRQLNLQFTDDTWERLLCSLERLEYVTDASNRPRSVATRLDQHKDKGEVRGSLQEVELEVHVQILAFKVVVAPVRDDAASWLLTDFTRWIAGRKGLTLNNPDEYAIPVIKCILGEQFGLPEVQDLPTTPISEREMRETVEKVGEAQHKTDKISERFSKNPDQKFTQHRHERGSFDDGMDRLKKIAEKSREQRWFERYYDDKPWLENERR